MKILNGLNLNGQRITALADGSGATDAVTKQQLDNALRGQSWKQPVRVATTTNGALATAYAAGQTIDGVTLTAGMRILLKDQTAGAENGIYTVNSSGAPSRAADADSLDELQNATVYVIAGTANADKAYTQTANDPTPGTTALVWAQVGGGTVYTASNGVALAGSNFTAQVKASGGILADSAGLYVDTSLVARKYAVNVPNGATTATITHNLGTKDVQVQVNDIASGEIVLADVVIDTVNTVQITFASAPSAGQYRAVVTG